MNAAIRLYADAANARTKLENGFDLTDYDQRTLGFAKEYSRDILAVDVTLDNERMLDQTWELFSRYFSIEELGIRSEFTEQYYKG